MYEKFLNRIPDAAGLNYWVGQVAGGMTFEWFQSFLIGSDEYYGSGAKGKGDNTDFVKSMYHDVLGRPVDSGGLNYFVSLLDAGTPRAQVVAADRLQHRASRQHGRRLLRASSSAATSTPAVRPIGSASSRPAPVTS